MNRLPSCCKLCPCCSKKIRWAKGFESSDSGRSLALRHLHFTTGNLAAQSTAMPKIIVVRHGQAEHNVAFDSIGSKAYEDPRYRDSRLTRLGMSLVYAVVKCVVMCNCCRGRADACYRPRHRCQRYKRGLRAVVLPAYSLYSNFNQRHGVCVCPFQPRVCSRQFAGDAGPRSRLQPTSDTR
jgi:hypothetical protein